MDSRPSELKEEILGLFDENYACTLTFGERAENHAGMQILGQEVANGYSMNELKEAKAKFEERGAECELVDLSLLLPVESRGPEAAVLVVRNAVKFICLNDCSNDILMFEQLNKIKPDTKALMRGRVVNKHARHNVCFAEEAQEADYESGKGTIVAFSHVHVLNYIREELPKWFGENARGMLCEGNYYYNVKTCGIGFHGDSERKRVIALRLGAPNPLHYQWFHRFKPVGERSIISLKHGDMYMMSEKAVGTDWKKSSILTLRHAAGCKKYTEI